VTFGLVVPQGWREDLDGRDFDTMCEVAQAAERLGFDSIWLYDHLQTRAGDPDRVLECWTSLGALARETKRVQLGQLVTSAGYRNPGLLAQMAATIDAASGGRVIVGLGAGWDEREWRDFGYGESLPPVGVRLARLEEALQVLRRRRGDRPILVGGAGERVLLRLVARYADACNLTDSFDPAYYRRKLEILRRHCEDVGRDYETIERTASFTVPRDVPGDLFEQLASAGIERFIVYLEPPSDLRTVERFAARFV
jgi:alkanesulfonate monooxygenase SsuD/methylene tetrahydromethanopterin reductase-like flavin-dependent oxidoreductase (luciferase family)